MVKHSNRSAARKMHCMRDGNLKVVVEYLGISIVLI